MILLMPILRLIFEIVLLFVMLYAGIRELSNLAIALIVFRLLLSFISRIFQIPDLLDEFEQIASGVIICVFKIALEVGIFFSLKEDISISTGFRRHYSNFDDFKKCIGDLVVVNYRA